MPSFNYVGVDDNGFEVKGVLAAENEDQLADQLRRDLAGEPQRNVVSRAAGY